MFVESAVNSTYSTFANLTSDQVAIFDLFALFAESFGFNLLITKILRIENFGVIVGENFLSHKRSRILPIGGR